MLTAAREVDAIVSEAIAIASPEERDAYVAQACGNDSALRHQVEGRLAVHFPTRNGAEKPSVAEVNGLASSRLHAKQHGLPEERHQAANGKSHPVENGGRKHPRLVTAAAILMLAAAGVCVCLSLWAIQKEKQANRAMQEAAEIRERAAQAEKQSKQQREQAEVTRRAAADERDRALEELKAANESAEEEKAALAFFQGRVLSAGRPVGWTGGQGKDVTLRKAVDAAESKVAGAFAGRPIAEATIRETLGSTYLDLNDPALAVKEYERALALREAVLGEQHPDTVACRNQLAVAYRLADRPMEASRLYEPENKTSTHATALAIRAEMLLAQKKPVAAEEKLRDCLALREQIQPNDWSTFEAKTLLGQALVQQKKYAEGEPLLVSGCEGMKQREATIPSQEKYRFTKALERLVQLYDAENQKDKAEKWRKELEKVKAPTRI